MIEPIDADRLRNARVQLHWAAQVLSATCDAVFKRLPDDSQSALHVYADDDDTSCGTREFPSGERLILDVRQAALWLRPDPDGPPGGRPRTSLNGLTIAQMIEWVAANLRDAHGVGIALRDYAMPPHPIGKGAGFDASDIGALSGVSRRMGTAWRVLREVVGDHGLATATLLWPHHFDLGSILLFAEGADPSKDPCVGIGYSLGDDSIDEPYFYANPYAIEKPDTLPSLGAGAWADSWFGAILRESDIRGAGVDPGTEQSRRMVHAMIDEVTALTRERAGF